MAGKEEEIVAWVRLDDAMPNHPKVMAAGPQGFALDVAGICYAARHGTGGYIPYEALPDLLPQLPKPQRWADRLCEVGRWLEVDFGWLIDPLPNWVITEDRRTLSRDLRRAIFERDGEVCGVCRTTVGPFHIDHLWPVAKGGSDDPDNLQVLCRRCNLFKSDLGLVDWLEKVEQAEVDGLLVVGGNWAHCVNVAGRAYNLAEQQGLVFEEVG